MRYPGHRGKELRIKTALQARFEAAREENLHCIRFPRSIQQEQVRETYWQQEALRFQSPNYYPWPPENRSAQKQRVESASVYVHCVHYWHGPRKCCYSERPPFPSRIRVSISSQCHQSLLSILQCLPLEKPTLKWPRGRKEDGSPANRHAT